jgi:hypothetical protein
VSPGRIQWSPYQQRQQTQLAGSDHDDAYRVHAQAVSAQAVSAQAVSGARPDGETQDYPGRDERDARACSRHPPPSGGPDHAAARAACAAVIGSPIA